MSEKFGVLIVPPVVSTRLPEGVMSWKISDGALQRIEEIEREICLGPIRARCLLLDLANLC